MFTLGMEVPAGDVMTDRLEARINLLFNGVSRFSLGNIRRL